MQRWAKLYQRRLLKGEKYQQLNRTVTLNILGYKLFPDTEWQDYHSCFAVLNTKDLKHALTRDLEIHFVELPKWQPQKGAKLTRLEHWLAYLSSKTTMEERRQLAMVDADIGIAKAVNALRNKGKSDAAIAELLDMDVKEVQLIQ